MSFYDLPPRRRREHAPHPSGSDLSGTARHKAGLPRQRVVRGGGLYDEARDCRCAYRLPCSPDYTAREVGFRVVLAPAWLKLGIVVATKADTTAGDRLQKTQSLE